MNDGSDGGDPRDLAELCKHAAWLMDAAPGPLKSVRLRDGELSVEVEWVEGDRVPGPPANGAHPAPAAAGADAAGAAAGAAVPEDDGTSFVVGAPLVGTFYRAPEPGARPFVEVGDEVAEGQQIGIVEAMKLMNAVHAERAGRVVEVRAADGTPVEYGEPLFLLAVT